MMRLPEQLKEEMIVWIAEYDKMPVEIPKGHRGAIVGMLNKTCGNDAQRHELLKRLFGKGSTKDLYDAEWHALEKWIDVKQFGSLWVPQDNLQDEVNCILGREPKGLFEFD